jgi:hypothetical protein
MHKRIFSKSPTIRLAITDLENELYRCQVKNISGRTFIPEGTLERILDGTHIGQTVQVFLTSPLIRSQNSDGLQSCKKIFVILVLADLLEFIEPVLNMIGIADSLLPMPDPQLLSGELLHFIQEEEKSRWGIWKTVSEVFGRPSYVERFFFSQWRVLAPSFRGKDEVVHYSFTTNHILPFLPNLSQTSDLLETDSDVLETQLRYGSFSEVRQVKIHPDHYDFGDYGVSLVMLVNSNVACLLLLDQQSEPFICYQEAPDSRSHKFSIRDEGFRSFPPAASPSNHPTSSDV